MISHEESLDTNLTPSLAQRRAFLKLPLDERRRILSQQADQIAQYYELESEQADREHWQGGDIVQY
jgi:hypothetical protein